MVKNYKKNGWHDKAYTEDKLRKKTEQVFELYKQRADAHNQSALCGNKQWQLKREILSLAHQRADWIRKAEEADKQIHALIGIDYIQEKKEKVEGK